MNQKDEKKKAYGFKADAETRTIIVELSEALTRRLGVRVSQGSAIRYAVAEALKREKEATA